MKAPPPSGGDKRFGGHPVQQPWVIQRPFMQQTVMFSALRGPDGNGKRSPVKDILRWYRRCILHTGLHGELLTTPDEPGGGKFFGPTQDPRGIEAVVNDFMEGMDDLPFHFLMHLTHGAECIAYGHPDARIAMWWLDFYERFAKSLHLHVESSAEFNRRLGGTFNGWAAADVVGVTDAWAKGFKPGEAELFAAVAEVPK
jgi:hypothetical protein